MSELDNLKDGFQFVSYKKKYLNKFVPATVNTDGEVTYDIHSAIRRILSAKEDLVSSTFYSSVTASLKEALQTLSTVQIKEIVCFGLGKIGECTVSRYQLALLLCLKELYLCDVFAYDPIFKPADCKVLSELKIRLLEGNCEGKLKLRNKGTLFFLPHCPKQLSNNLLWANWGLNLSNCIIISNSFSQILESNTKRVIAENANYIFNISPYTVELAIINSFTYYEIFNDTALHIFPPAKLSLISQDFWSDSAEPQYQSEDVEFITNKLSVL